MESCFRHRLVRMCLCAPVLVAAVAVNPARADWMWLGGAEAVFDGRFAQMTALFPFSGQLGSGFVHRYSVSYIEYEYPVEDTTVEAESWSASVALGYQIPVTDGWLGFAAGPAYRRTTYQPPQPDNPQQGSNVVAQVDLDAGRMQSNRWLYATSISYTPRYRAYWGRGRVLRRIGERSFLGPEFVAHGDRDYDAQQLGIALYLSRVAGPLDLVLKAGGKQIRDGDSGAYAGIEFLHHFQ
jgi:hypothetical protein